MSSLGDSAEEGQRLTVHQVAKLAEVSAAAVRSWVRRSLLPPSARSGRLLWFDFRAVGRARTLGRFLAAGWSGSRIERGLAVAVKLCPDADRALEGLLASLEAGHLAVRLPDGRVSEPSGQLLLDFGAAAPAPDSERVRALKSHHDWFVAGVEAEAGGRLEEAVRSYERALAGGDPEVSFNLGNCLFALRRLEPACQSFEAALQREPDYAEAWNNLGIARGELGRGPQAIEAFRRALEIVPHYADAHFNLAEALAVAGELEGARRHFRAYLSYDPNSRWADQVRQRLQQLEGRRGG
jgi:tetratricopeptide (TPR) repeat protein